MDKARRLPPCLEQVRAYLDGSFRQPYEVIVVDDGSRDETATVVQGLASQWPQLCLLRHAENQGKGSRRADGDVGGSRGTTAVCRRRRRRADRRARPPGGGDLAGPDVAIGSRLLRDPTARRRRPWNRALTGRLFALAARRLLRISALDTQCGFKLFRAAAGRRLFAAIEETGYLFDLEIFLLAQRFGLRVVEVPIDWQEIPGGHFHPWGELPALAAGLWRLRRR